MICKLGWVWEGVIQDDCMPDPDVLDGSERIIDKGLVDCIQHIPTFCHLDIGFARSETRVTGYSVA